MERVALVTGGGGAIGRAICVALAEQGRKVGVADLNADAARDTATGLSEAGSSAVGVGCDVTSAASVRAAVGSIGEQLGQVEILVNCAGWDDFVPFVDTDEYFWDRVIDINFKGVLHTCSAVVPGMISTKWGRVVNIGSDAGRVGSSLESVYSGAKGGVIAFTKSLAREVARDGVTANTVCPGPTDTPPIHQMTDRLSRGEGFVEALERAIPMRRLARPEEVAHAAAFFTAEDSGYITGQTLSVSGGLTMS